jgi:hypothetical protein
MTAATSGPGSFSMVLVEDRAWTRRIDALDLRCDELERLTELPRTYERWLAGAYMRTYPQPADDHELVQRSGRATLAIGDRRIIAPDAGRQPAVWFSVGLDDLLTIEVIRRDLIWRPTMLRIRASGWSFAIAYVAVRPIVGVESLEGSPRTELGDGVGRAVALARTLEPRRCLIPATLVRSIRRSG